MTQRPNRECVEYLCYLNSMLSQPLCTDDSSACNFQSYFYWLFLQTRKMPRPLLYRRWRREYTQNTLVHLGRHRPLFKKRTIHASVCIGRVNKREMRLSIYQQDSHPGSKAGSNKVSREGINGWPPTVRTSPSAVPTPLPTLISISSAASTQHYALLRCDWRRPRPRL